MIRNKIRSCLLTLILFLPLSLSAFAAEDNQADPVGIAAPAAAHLPVQPVVAAAPVGAVDADIQAITDATARLQLRMGDLEAKRATAVARVQTLEAALAQRETDLAQTDAFLAYFMDATPTARAYLFARFRNETQAKQGALWDEALRPLPIPNIIVGVNKQIRGATPQSSQKLLDLSNVRRHVSAAFPTVTYVDATIPGSPEQPLRQQVTALDNMLARMAARQQAVQPEARRRLAFDHIAVDPQPAQLPLPAEPLAVAALVAGAPIVAAAPVA